MAGSFQVVGTLLVFGLLIAPPAAALPWAKSIPAVMGIAAVLGCTSVLVGLLVSWHAQTAAGATIAATAVALFFASSALKAAWPPAQQTRISPTRSASSDRTPALAK